jgi:hypothetical protein
MADTAKLPAIPETNEDTRDIVGTDDDITVGWGTGTSKQTDSSEVPRADKHNTHHADSPPFDTPHALYRQPSKGINSRTADRPSLIKGHSRWNLSAPQLVRGSSTTDLATGKEGGKETVCEEVIMAKDAMNPARRLYSKFFSFRTEKEEDIETASPKQYRLTSRRVSETCVCESPFWYKVPRDLALTQVLCARRKKSGTYGKKLPALVPMEREAIVENLRGVIMSQCI